jgi:hypothetical protein
MDMYTPAKQMRKQEFELSMAIIVQCWCFCIIVPSWFDFGDRRPTENVQGFRESETKK